MDDKERERLECQWKAGRPAVNRLDSGVMVPCVGRTVDNEHQVRPGTRWRDARNGEVVEVLYATNAEPGWYDVVVASEADSAFRDGRRFIVPGDGWVFEGSAARAATSRVEAADPPDAGSVARLLVRLFAVGMARGLMTAEERRGIVLRALDLLEQEGV